MAATDSAGVPWEGREFETNTFAADDGSAPPHVLDALLQFRAGEVGERAVVDALRDSRLLIPLVTELGDGGLNDEGRFVDKSQELAVVTVQGPDGRTVQPAFTSVEAMKQWDATARPIPLDAVRVALGAAQEGTDVVVIDPTAPTEFAIRRPALWAIARQVDWEPCYLDLEVLDAFMAGAEAEASVVSVQLAPGDTEARLAGPELVVQLDLVDGLDAEELTALVQRVQERWAANELIAERVDSLAVRLARADAAAEADSE